MTAEAALREVLGFCFMQTYGLPTQATPLAVTAFSHRKKLMGYGMLLRVKSENRVESHIEVPQCTIRDVIAVQTNPSLSISDWLLVLSCV